MRLHKQPPIQNPFSAEFFQLNGTNELKRVGVEMTPALSGVQAFPAPEVEALRGLKAKLPQVDFEKLPVNYTTEMPVARGNIIGVASAKIYLASPQENGKTDAKETIAHVDKALDDLQKLMAEKYPSEFVVEMIGKTKQDLSSLKVSKNGEAMLAEANLAKVNAFEKQISDIDAVVKAMYEAGMAGLGIYRKLRVDLDYLRAMDDFIDNTVKKVQSVRADLGKKYASLQHRLSNIETALEHTEPRTWMDKLGGILKGLTGVGLVSTATFIAAKGEIMHFLEQISNMPNLIYAGAVFVVGMAVVGVYLSVDVWKALRQNHYIKAYGKRMDKLVKSGIEYTRRNLKVVGFKATKEAAFAGYIEALQGEASERYLVAAYQGDFDAINAIYDQQVDRMAGKRTLGWQFRRLKEFFSKDQEKGMNHKISQEAVERDGHFADIVRGIPESEQPSQ